MYLDSAIYIRKVQQRPKQINNAPNFYSEQKAVRPFIDSSFQNLEQGGNGSQEEMEAKTLGNATKQYHGQNIKAMLRYVHRFQLEEKWP